MYVCKTEFFSLFIYLFFKGLEFLVCFILLGLDICISQINADVLDFRVLLILKSKVKQCSC